MKTNKMISENVSRKLDSLGRISIPKAIRQRLCIEDLSEVDFYTMEDDNGVQYIGMSSHQENNVRFKVAAEVLQELGLPIPKELEERL